MPMCTHLVLLMPEAQLYTATSDGFGVRQSGGMLELAMANHCFQPAQQSTTHSFELPHQQIATNSSTAHSLTNTLWLQLSSARPASTFPCRARSSGVGKGQRVLVVLISKYRSLQSACLNSASAGTVYS